MKNFLGAVAAASLAVLMIVSVVSPVNLLAGNSKSTIADGWPMPPKPTGPGTGVLTADGWPMPPKPTSPGTSGLVADGWPMPPKPTGPGVATAAA